MFPRYTAPGDETAAVMTTLLAGAPFDERSNPGYGSEPDNLFTRLAPAYRMVVSEEVTGSVRPDLPREPDPDDAAADPDARRARARRTGSTPG